MGEWGEGREGREGRVFVCTWMKSCRRCRRRCCCCHFTPEDGHHRKKKSTVQHFHFLLPVATSCKGSKKPQLISVSLRSSWHGLSLASIRLDSSKPPPPPPSPPPQSANFVSTRLEIGGKRIWINEPSRWQSKRQIDNWFWSQSIIKIDLDSRTESGPIWREPAFICFVLMRPCCCRRQKSITLQTEIPSAISISIFLLEKKNNKKKKEKNGKKEREKEERMNQYDCR